MVADVYSKRPDHILDTFLTSWVAWAGLPKILLSYCGGEFNKEFNQEFADLEVDLRWTAAYSPTQNARVERHGGRWKDIAKALIMEFSISWKGCRWRISWLIAYVNNAVNMTISESGYSPSQWVLGRGLKLPCTMLSSSGRLAAQTPRQGGPRL